MLENNSKVAAGHPDLGYSISLKFICLAPTISVCLKLALEWPPERHLFILTKVLRGGKGHSEVANCISSPVSLGILAVLSSLENITGCGFCTFAEKQWLGNINSSVRSDRDPSSDTV